MLRSNAITQGIQRSPNRAMLRAVGFDDNDFNKPIIGIANGHSTITPCNMGLMDLANRAEAALKEAGACLLYTSPSPRDKRQSRMPSSA